MAQHCAITFLRPGRRRRGPASPRRSNACAPAASGMYDVRVTGDDGDAWWRSSAAIAPHGRQVLQGGGIDGDQGLDPIETASRDEIAALQRERLAWTLRHAYDNVPHYRAAFDAAGVHPDDFRDLDDLAKFPFTTKQDLRANYPFGMFAVPREKLVRIHASSGTTGKPTVVGYTAQDIETWAQVVARSIYAAGGRPGMIVHIAYGYGLFTGGLGAALRRGAAGLHRGAGVRRHDRAPGAADRRFPPRRDHGHAELHAGDPGRVPPPGPRSPRLLAEDRHLRRRTLDQRDAPRDRGSASRWTPWTSTACPR